MNFNIALYTFLDVEASGLRQPDSYPIEVGWSDTLGNQDSFLIRPASDWSYWDANAQLVHGISREQLLSDGLCVSEAAERLNALLGVEKVYCDAPDFDGFWLNRLFEAAGVEMSFILADVYYLYNEMSRDHRLIMLDYLNDHPAPHRALADAKRYVTAFTMAARHSTAG